jgi:hypothetical protein
MRIAVAGGLGTEKRLLSILKGDFVFLLGSAYHLSREKFELYREIDFMGEYLTHNYKNQFLDYDFTFDISQSLKSKFTVSEFALSSKKKAFLLFYQKGWKLFSQVPGGACLSCYQHYERPEPALLWPEISKNFEAAVKQAISSSKKKSTVIDLEKLSETTLKADPDCPAHNGKFSFLTGQMADVVSVSCGEETVGVSPMNEVNLDFEQFKKKLSSFVKIVKENAFFLEFQVGRFNATLFRQGRLLVKGTKEKNTGLFIYRNYVGS